jgi:hypothetical protein
MRIKYKVVMFWVHMLMNTEWVLEGSGFNRLYAVASEERWFVQQTIYFWWCLELQTPLLTLSNPIFLPPAYSPTLVFFGQERGWWITCNYPTVLKEKNINRKSTTCAICWLKSVLHGEKLLSSCSMDFSQQIALVVLFLFLFFSFKSIG